MDTYVNQGVTFVTGYLNRNAEKQLLAVHSDGREQEVEIYFSYKDTPSPTDTDSVWNYIPANSLITSVYFEVITAFASGTSYAIDLCSIDGTTSYGTLWAALLLASINTLGERGAATTTPLAVVGDSYFRAVPTGVFTAGELRVVIKYNPPAAASL